MSAKLPNGRPPDPENQAEAQALAERFVSKNVRKYLKVLDDIAMNEEAPPDQRRMAISTLFERGLGKSAVPERDDQLGKLAGIIKDIAKISNQQSNTRVTEVRSGEPDLGGENGIDPVRSLPAPQQESSVDYSTSEGDS